jgi:hypothetical protein
MGSCGVVYAKVPVGGATALDAAVRAARAVSRHSSPLGVLALDPALHAFAIVDRWGHRDDMPMWAEEPDLSSALELLNRRPSNGDIARSGERHGGNCSPAPSPACIALLACPPARVPARTVRRDATRKSGASCTQ